MRLSFCCGCALLVGNLGTLLAAGIQDLQYGEPVAAANQAAIDAPLVRHPEAAWFELSGLREIGPGGEIAVSFQRITPGTITRSEFVLVVKSDKSRQDNPVREAFQERGVVRGRSGSRAGGQPAAERFEVWMEQHLRHRNTTLRMKVSKSITTPKVDQLTLARPWTIEQQNLLLDWSLENIPPQTPPPGYQFVELGTKLLPGMMVMAGWKGKWEPAEVIDVRKHNSALVRYTRQNDSLVARTRQWLAIDLKTLQAAQANPAKFKPSVKVLPGGTTPVPGGLVPVEANTPLVKGTPLKGEHAGKWEDLTVIEVRPDGKLRIRWGPDGPPWDQDVDRDKLLIEPQTLADLKKPRAADRFATRMKKMKPEGSFGSSKRWGRPQNIPIELPIPDNAVRVTDQTPLEDGIRLGVCWFGKWHDVYVVEVNSDNSVTVRFEDDPDKVEDLWRQSLIIDKQVLARLQTKTRIARAAKPGPKAAAAGAGGADQQDQLDQFKVVLKAKPDNVIAVTRLVVDMTGLELKDAKEFVESAPITIRQNLDKLSAERLQKQLQAAGADVAVELQSQ